MSVDVPQSCRNLNRSIPSEIEVLKTNEFQRRRKLRLQQVREQAKDIAKRLRERSHVEKNRQINDVGSKQSQQYIENQEKLVQHLEQVYSNSLLSVGASHNAAAALNEGSAISKADLSKVRAKTAAAHLQQSKQVELDKRRSLLDRKLEARKLANERSRDKALLTDGKVAPSCIEQATKQIDEACSQPDATPQVQNNVVTNVEKKDMETQWDLNNGGNINEIPNSDLGKKDSLTRLLDGTSSDLNLDLHSREVLNKRSDLFALSDEMPLSLRGGLEKKVSSVSEEQSKASLNLVSDFLKSRDKRLPDPKTSFNRVASQDLHGIKDTLLRTRRSRILSGGKTSSSRISKSSEQTLNKKSSVTQYDHNTKSTKNTPFRTNEFVEKAVHDDDEDAYSLAFKESNTLPDKDRHQRKEKQEHRTKVAVSKEKVAKEYEDTIAFLSNLSKQDRAKPIKSSYMDDDRQENRNRNHQRRMQAEFEKTQVENTDKARINVGAVKMSSLGKSRGDQLSRTTCQKPRDDPKGSFNYSSDTDDIVSVALNSVTEVEDLLHHISTTRQDTHRKSIRTLKSKSPDNKGRIGSVVTFDTLPTRHEYQSSQKHTPPTKDKVDCDCSTRVRVNKNRNIDTVIPHFHGRDVNQQDRNSSDSILSSEGTIENTIKGEPRIHSDCKGKHKNSQLNGCVKCVRSDKDPNFLNQPGGDSHGHRSRKSRSPHTIKRISKEELPSDDVNEGGEQHIIDDRNGSDCFCGGLTSVNTAEKSSQHSNVKCACACNHAKRKCSSQKRKNFDTRPVQWDIDSSEPQRDLNRSVAACTNCSTTQSKDYCARCSQQSSSGTSYRTATNIKPLESNSKGIVNVLEESGTEAGKFYIDAADMRESTYEVVIQFKKKERSPETVGNNGQLPAKSRQHSIPNTEENDHGINQFREQLVHGPDSRGTVMQSNNLNGVQAGSVSNLAGIQNITSAHNGVYNIISSGTHSTTSAKPIVTNSSASNSIAAPITVAATIPPFHMQNILNGVTCSESSQELPTICIPSTASQVFQIPSQMNSAEMTSFSQVTGLLYKCQNPLQKMEGIAVSKVSKTLQTQTNEQSTPVIMSDILNTVRQYPGQISSQTNSAVPDSCLTQKQSIDQSSVASPEPAPQIQKLSISGQSSLNIHMSSSTSTAYMSPPEMILPSFLKYNLTAPVKDKILDDPQKDLCSQQENVKFSHSHSSISEENKKHYAKAKKTLRKIRTYQLEESYSTSSTDICRKSSSATTSEHCFPVKERPNYECSESSSRTNPELPRNKNNDTECNLNKNPRKNKSPDHKLPNEKISQQYSVTISNKFDQIDKLNGAIKSDKPKTKKCTKSGCKHNKAKNEMLTSRTNQNSVLKNILAKDKSAHQAQSNLNPIVKKYIQELLQMNKDGLKAIDIASLHCSSVSTPGSSIVNIPSNTDLQLSPYQSHEILAQFKQFLKMNSLNGLGTKDPCSGSNSTTEQGLGDNTQKLHKQLTKQRPAKRHKIKALNVSKNLYKYFKTVDSEESKKSVYYIPSLRFADLDKSHSKKRQRLKRNKNRTRQNHNPAKLITSDFLKSTSNVKNANSKVPDRKNINNDIDTYKSKSPLVTQAKSAPVLEIGNDKLAGTEKLVKLIKTKQKSDFGQLASHRQQNEETQTNMSLKFSNKGINDNKTESSFTTNVTNPMTTSTQTIQSTTDNVNLIKIAEEKLLNMEKIADLTEKCTKRLSNLAKVLEEVRKNKPNIYSQMSSAESSDNDKSVTGKNILLRSKSETEPQDLLDYKKCGISAVTDLTSNVEFAQPLKSASAKIKTSEDGEFFPLLGDIPKPQMTGSSVSSYKISTLDDDKTNHEINSDLVDSVNDKMKFRPPTALSRVNFKNNFEPLVPHELSTVIEVDSPSSLKLKNNSQENFNNMHSKESLRDIVGSHHESAQMVNNSVNREANESLENKKEGGDKKQNDEYDDYGRSNESNLVSANVDFNILPEVPEHCIPDLSISTQNNSKLQMMDLNKFNEIMLKPFISIEEYAHKYNIAVLDEGSVVEGISNLPSLNDDISSLHSDGTLPDIITELLKRNVINKPFSFDTASNDSSTAISSESAYSVLALSKVKSSNKKVRSKKIVTDSATSESFSISSNPDLEKAFEKIGLCWASSTLKKTKETLALSSSTSASQSSASKDIFRNKKTGVIDKELKEILDIISDTSTVADHVRQISSINTRNRSTEDQEHQFNTLEDATLKFSVEQQTSLQFQKPVTVKEFLAKELSKKITFTRSPQRDIEDRHSSVHDTKTASVTLNVQGNDLEKTSRCVETNEDSFKNNLRRRTSTPVQIFKSLTYNSSSSSYNNSNGLFSNVDDLSSVKGTTDSMRHSSTEKDDLTIPNFSLRVKKVNSSECSISDASN